MNEFGDFDKNLTLLQEECSEIIRQICKIKRFGINDVNPSTGKSNDKELIQEIGDTLLIVDILKENGMMTHRELEEAKQRKREKLKKWY